MSSHNEYVDTPPTLQPMKDWILFTIVAVIVSVDVVFLVIVSVDVWRLRLTPQLVPRQVRKYSIVITMKPQGTGSCQRKSCM